MKFENLVAIIAYYYGRLCPSFNSTSKTNFHYRFVNLRAKDINSDVYEKLYCQFDDSASVCLYFINTKGHVYFRIFLPALTADDLGLI